jgi:para-nitrobenzyl esterase
MVVVTTRDGRLAGAREGVVSVWRGVPYAAPPVGPLRFRAPRPGVPWSGTREALRFGPSAPQVPNLAEGVLGLDGHVPSSEDCLVLNIWSQGPGGAPRPVMVWLHGGGFITGAASDSLYDGRRFAERGDVVVVTLNYRLGPLGFLHLFGTGGAETNLGLRDQIAALGWVRDNIAAFGGDPGNVTLFGQSAGAMAIGALLGVPAARPLFRRAILQSGAARHVHDRPAAERLTRLCLRHLGLRGVDMDALRALPVEAFTAACLRMMTGVSVNGLPFQPVVDGDLMPQPPLAAVGAGAACGIPLLVSTTRDEIALYAIVAERDPRPRLVKRWHRLLAIARLPAMIGARRLARLLRAYRDEGSQAFASDLVFRQPALDLAEAQGPHAPVFMARFDWPSPAYGGRLGACHAVDIPFVWNTLDSPGARTIGRDGPAERALADAVQDAWITFARDGVPQARGLPAWPRYDTSRRATMILDTASRIEDDPRAAQRQAWC